MKKTMYQITEEMSEVLSELEQKDGEFTEELAEQYELSVDNRETKAIAYLEKMGQGTALIARIDAEIKRLNAIKKRTQNTNLFLTDMLIRVVRLFGEFAAGLTTVSVRKNKALSIDDAVLDSIKKITDEDWFKQDLELAGIDKNFINKKTTYALDKKGITDAIKADEEVSGCSLIDTYHLNTK